MELQAIGGKDISDMEVYGGYSNSKWQCENDIVTCLDLQCRY